MFSRSIVIIAVIGISTNWKLQQRECKISLVVFNTLSLTKKKRFDRFCKHLQKEKKEKKRRTRGRTTRKRRSGEKVL